MSKANTNVCLLFSWGKLESLYQSDGRSVGEYMFFGISLSFGHSFVRILNYNTTCTSTFYKRVKCNFTCVIYIKCTIMCKKHFYVPRKISGEHIVAALSVSPSVRTSHSCPAHNFVIWSGISKLFHRNYHHIEMTCRAQHLGRYLEGQGHSMTLQHNRVQSIT